jgi:hypothetical protein
MSEQDANKESGEDGTPLPVSETMDGDSGASVGAQAIPKRMPSRLARVSSMSGELVDTQAVSLNWFGDHTSCHVQNAFMDDAYPSLYEGGKNPVWRKTIWGTLWLAAAIYIIITVSTQFYPKLTSDETTTTVTVEEVADLAPPSLTVCNENPYDGSKYTFTDSEEITTSQLLEFVPSTALGWNCEVSTSTRIALGIAADCNDEEDPAKKCCSGHGNWTNFLDPDYGSCSTWNWHETVRIAQSTEPIATHTFTILTEGVQPRVYSGALRAALHSSRQHFRDSFLAEVNIGDRVYLTAELTTIGE